LLVPPFRRLADTPRLLPLPPELVASSRPIGPARMAFGLPGVDHDKREGKWWRFEGDEA
jgi:hypothetical protein